jgi:hypothetical protein
MAQGWVVGIHLAFVSLIFFMCLSSVRTHSEDVFIAVAAVDIKHLND